MVEWVSIQKNKCAAVVIRMTRSLATTVVEAFTTTCLPKNAVEMRILFLVRGLALESK